MRVALFIPVLIAAAAISAETKSPAVKADDFRILDGCLFNVTRSEKWAGLGEEGHSLKVVEISAGQIVVQEVWREYIYGAPRVDRLARVGGFVGGAGSGPAPRPIIGHEDKEGEFSFIANYPFLLKIGEVLIVRPTVIPIGTREFRGQQVNAYNWGLRNTPVNRLTLTNESLRLPAGKR